VALFRRRKLPAVARPPLGADERVVAWALAPSDLFLVVTNLGVWLPGATARLGWHEIHKATWSGRQLALVGTREVGTGPGYDVLADEAAGVHTLIDPDRVPEQVRVRVTRSIAYTRHYPEPGVRVVARRTPGVDGLRWTVRYDDGVDPADPAVQAATAAYVAEAKAAVSVVPPG
jgi:hypothetical protein